jgi:hypothetical protein
MHNCLRKQSRISAQLSPIQVHTCAHLFSSQLRTNAQLSEKQLCISAQLSIKQAHIPCTPVFFPPPCPHAWLCQAQPHTMHGKRDYTRTHVHGYSSFSRALVGPYPKNTPVRPSIHPLPTFYKFHMMQEDRTTNLSLATPRSVDSCSCNLQISSEYSRQFSYSDRYK